MRTRKRLTKQQLKRDRFVDTTFDWVIWARENGRTVAVIAGGVLLVALAFILYRTSEARETRQASQRFQEIIQTYAAGNFQLAANDFKQFLSQHGGSMYGDQATLYLANSYMLASDPKAAVKTLEDSRDRLDGSRLAYEAASLQGSAYEAAGDLGKAAESYGHAREKARYDFERAQALMNEARVYGAQKATEKAVEAYRQVIQKYPGSAMAMDAQVRVAELTAKPLGAPAAAAAPSGSSEEASVAADSASLTQGASAKPAAVMGAAEPAMSVQPPTERTPQQR
jgi:outer membrane protein assembly factor BamD (BamD/ComL family)